MKILSLLIALILILVWFNIPKEEANEIEIVCGGMELVYEYKYPKFAKGRE